MSTNTPHIARSKPANFNWEDPFLLESQLTEEERMIRDTAKAYCHDKLFTRIIEASRFRSCCKWCVYAHDIFSYFYFYLYWMFLTKEAMWQFC